METLVKQQISIKTEILQELVSKAVKACSMVEAFPITGLIELVCKDNTLTVITTDNINVLTLIKTSIEGELNAVVDARLFSALIARLTTPLTTLSVENGILTVSANGKYDFKIVTEEDGTLIHIPVSEFNFDVSYNHISSEDLRTILTMNKSAKADVKEMPSIFNYYMDGERVLTTDLYRVCTNPVKLFNNPVCLTPELVELIPLVCDDRGVEVKENEDKVCFSSTKATVIGRKAIKEDLANFPVKDLIESLNDQFTYTCVINRTCLMNALDRICLFTNGLTINAVNLKFEKEISKHYKTIIIFHLCRNHKFWNSLIHMY